MTIGFILLIITGALKYYLANNFMVATGDDPEKDDGKEEKPKAVKYATPEQIKIITAAYTGEAFDKLLSWAKIKTIEQMPMEMASGIIKRLEERKK